MKFRHLVPALALIGITACDSAAPPVNPGSNPANNLRFVSGVHGSVNVLVDGTPVLSNVALGASVAAGVAPGSHTIVIQKVGGASGVSRTVTLTAGETAIIIATDSAGAPRPSILLDTNTVVAPGKTKLRVAHFAAGAAGITPWRTQPDFAQHIRVQFPFPYNTPGTYLESDPGDWRVMISSEQNGAGNAPMPDTLANTGLISIPAGQSRTVVVVDGATAGSVQLIVVNP